MQNTQTPLQQRGPVCVAPCLARTHGEDIEDLCSAPMHWLWSYVTCLPRRWREMAARANIRRRSVAAVHLGGRPCRASNAAARHSVTNNAWRISHLQTLLLSVWWRGSVSATGSTSHSNIGATTRNYPCHFGKSGFREHLTNCLDLSYRSIW